MHVFDKADRTCTQCKQRLCLGGEIVSKCYVLFQIFQSFPNAPRKKALIKAIRKIKLVTV